MASLAFSMIEKRDGGGGGDNDESGRRKIVPRLVLADRFISPGVCYEVGLDMSHEKFFYKSVNGNGSPTQICLGMKNQTSITVI